MLIGNYSVLSKNPGRSIGGGAIGLGMNRSDSNKSSMARGAFVNDAWEPKSGIPDGYRNPYCWVLPIKSGALSARNNLNGSGSATIAMAGGVNGAATLAGSGTLTGAGALIISMVAALSGSGTISSASAAAYLNLAATLAGDGDLAGSIQAIAHAAAALAGDGDITGTINALGTLEAALVVTGTGLTTSNVGAAVWAAIASSNNEPGSMGEKLNDAGSASNPWTETLPGAYVAGSAGYILGNQLANILSGIGARMVESGMTQDEVTRILLAYVAGNVSGGPASPEFMSVDGLTVRIGGTADSSGNRTTTTLDGS